MFCKVTPSVMVMVAKNFGVGSLMIARAASSSGVVAKAWDSGWSSSSTGWVRASNAKARKEKRRMVIFEVNILFRGLESLIFWFWKCFEEVEGRDRCLDEVVKLMFVCEEGEEERSFGSIYRRAC